MLQLRLVYNRLPSSLLVHLNAFASMHVYLLQKSILLRVFVFWFNFHKLYLSLLWSEASTST